MQQYPEFKIF